MDVVFRNGKREMPVIVIKGCSQANMLLGRNWLDELYPLWREAFKVNDIKSKNDDFFKRKFSPNLAQYLEEILWN